MNESVPVTIYHNPACGTSRNTLALIRNAGVEPTVITRPLPLYVNVSAASRPEVKDFLHFYLSATNPEIVTKVGYVPLQLSALTAQTARLDKDIQGSLFGGHGAVIGVKSDWFKPDDEEKVKNLLVQ